LTDYPPLGSHKIVALIPARAGSKRVPLKNFRDLGGKALLQWSIDVALECGLFTEVIVSSDLLLVAPGIARVHLHHRKPQHATDDAPDFPWVNDVMQDRPEDIFCILRPTSPFRTASTIRRAYARLIGSRADSVRAVEVAAQHPGKMWIDDGKWITPLLDRRHPDGTPWHSSPTQSLPRVYTQNASLEMAWTYVLRQHGNITGARVAPFLTEALEGFDINTPDDFERAEVLARESGRRGDGGEADVRRITGDGEDHRPGHARATDDGPPGVER
jgi:CMP-N,N'-diacetyllegionaminic acid synthase